MAFSFSNLFGPAAVPGMVGSGITGNYSFTLDQLKAWHDLLKKHGLLIDPTTEAQVSAVVAGAQLMGLPIPADMVSYVDSQTAKAS